MSFHEGEFETMITLDERYVLLNEIRKAVPMFEAKFWGNDIRIRYEYPDPLYPQTHTLTKTWWVADRTEWESQRASIAKSHENK